MPLTEERDCSSFWLTGAPLAVLTTMKARTNRILHLILARIRHHPANLIRRVRATLKKRANQSSIPQRQSSAPPVSAASSSAAVAAKASNTAASNGFSDVRREQELQALAMAATTQKGLLNVSTAATGARVSHLGSVKFIWKDLREHSQSLEIVYRAVQKFGDKAAIFAESCAALDSVKFSDRTLIEDKEHLIFWQMPPSAKVFQEILTRNPNCNVYLIEREPATVMNRAHF